MNEIGDDKFVLLRDGISVLVIFFSKNPAIDSLRYRDFLLFVEPQKSLH